MSSSMSNNMQTGHEIMRSNLIRDEKLLRLELDYTRQKYEHAGIKGGQVEAVVRDFLDRYLPAHNRVGHGEVFNIDGLRSRQTDLVVANEYHIALTSDWSEAQTYIIEAVQCAAEIKSKIENVDTDLRDYFDKAQTFKKLLINPDATYELRMLEGDLPRFGFRKPYFGFAFESKVSLPRVMQELRSWDEELRPVERPAIDALFVLDRGAVVNVGDGQGRIYSLTPSGQRRTGYVEWSGDDNLLLSNLLTWMFATMPMVHYYMHPASCYLEPNQHPGRLELLDDGTLSRR